MQPLLLVCLGGAVGSGLRFAISRGLEDWAVRAGHAAFPWGTFTVNLAGSFLLGLLLSARTGDAGGTGISPPWRYALGTGALGGFTTYSTFNYETLCQIQAGHLTSAMTYAGATILCCLLAGAAGMLLGRVLLP